MMILSLTLFAVVLAVIAFAASRDLANIREIEPGTEDDPDSNTIRIAV